VLDGDAAIDLLVVDYVMPGMSGAETVRRARQRRAGLKALLITGHAAVQPRPADVGILQKPFSPAELARRIAEALAE